MSAKLLPLASDTITPIPPAVKLAKNSRDFPDGFLNILETEWIKNGASFQKDLSIMADLKAIEVLCKDGVRRPISKTYLPTTKLSFIHKKYTLDKEDFPFILLPRPLSTAGLGLWAFLGEHFDVKITDDLNFYLEILVCIRRCNFMVVTEYPRRVLELYLRIHSVCKASKDPSSKYQVREAFETKRLLLLSLGWANPSSVVLDKPTTCVPRNYLLPPPVTWDVMEEEAEVLKLFYKDTLGVQYFTCNTILNDLQRPADMTLERLQSSYLALYESVPRLGKESVSRLKEHFENNLDIYIIRKNGAMKRYKSGDCMWSGGMKVPNKVDLSQHYAGLEPFFTQLLKIKTYKGGILYKELTRWPPKKFAVNDLKPLLWSLNDELAECGQFLDPQKFRSCRVFPTRKIGNYDSEAVELCSTETEFFIADLPFLYTSFAGRARMLDFTAHEVWRLEPLLIWAGLESKYLSWNVEEETVLRDAHPKPLQSPFTPARALALARIASHFRSPRAGSNVEEAALAQKLIQTNMFQTDGIYSRLILNKRDPPIMLVENEADIHLEERGGVLNVYVPNWPDAVEFCYMSKLPRRFVEWIMTDPTTQVIGRVDEVAVSIVKSILNTKDSLTSRILDAEGIFEAPNNISQEGNMSLIQITPPSLLRPATPDSERVQSENPVEDMTVAEPVAPSTPKQEERQLDVTWSDTPTPKNNEIGHKFGLLSISDERISIHW